MAKINFIRTYSFGVSEMCDIVYDSGRLYTMCVEDMPATAKRFIESATHKVVQYDKVLKHDETLYTAD